MYFTKIRLNGLSVVDLPIVDAKPSDIYILKNAMGLGPPEVDVSIVNTLNAGGFYQGRRPQPREIVLHIGLNPNYGIDQTASDLRQTLYGMLTPGLTDNVRIDIMNDDIVLANTTGYVKKLEISPFSNTPEVQMTLACLQQYFLAPVPLYLEPPDKANPLIDNVGTAPAGFHMELTFTAAVTNWTLTDPIGTKMHIVYNFASGDTLIIDTRPGNRGIWVRRNSVLTNIIYALSTDSIWYMLHGGDNVFTTSSQAFNWGDLFYLPQYWGI
jgi:Phage tail protein